MARSRPGGGDHGRTGRVHDASVDAHRLGSAVRTLRLNAGLTQAQLAARAGASPSTVSRIERGLADRLPMSTVHAVGLALDAWVAFSVRWRGGELDRAINAGHAAMHEALARWIRQIGGWELSPEVSISIFGERGVIDALCWHASSRTLLVVELKTELVDISEHLGTFDRKVRLAARIAADRGWDPAEVAAWLLVAESRTNHRRLAAHRQVIRAALPEDGRRLDGWLKRPRGRLRALSFLPIDHVAGLRPAIAPRKRVSRRRRA